MHVHRMIVNDVGGCSSGLVRAGLGCEMPWLSGGAAVDGSLCMALRPRRLRKWL